MAIQFKTEEEKKLEKKAKKPKTKLQIAHKILFIASIVASIVLLFYFIGCFSPNTIIAPLAVFWLFMVLVPTAFSAGLVWAASGYRAFIKDVTFLLGNVIKSYDKIVKVLLNSLPYVGGALLSIILAYGILSFINYKKNREDKRYSIHFIVSIVMFTLALLFMIIALVILPQHIS